MSLEILFYVALGILWLVLQALGKRKKAQQRAAGQPQRPPVTLQDVLTEMEWIPSERPAALDPAPVDIQRIGSTPVKPALPVAKPVPTSRSSELGARMRVQTHGESDLMKQLRDPRSAQTAILVAEILGKPRALQGPWPLSR